MTQPRFLQIHSLHSYPAALLNRDDSGFAKRLPFGGASRTRVSSQCLKRHWRMAENAKALANIPGATKAVRSRKIVERRIIAHLRSNGFSDEIILETIQDAFQALLYDGDEALLLGFPEIEFLCKTANHLAESCPADKESAKKYIGDFLGLEKSGKRKKKQDSNIEFRKNIEKMKEENKMPGGLSSALFGRMMTSDPASNIDASIHVAHAFTVHPEESEDDYFSVVDDLHTREEDQGAAHINTSELTSGLFYGYVVVDVPALVSNLTGTRPEDWMAADTDRAMAGDVIDHLIHLIATVSPGAKKGSTAPYAYADVLMIEAGDRQPRTLANAFRAPVPPRIDAATGALGAHLEKLDAAYGTGEVRRFMSLENLVLPGAARGTLAEVAVWAADAVRSGKAA